MPQLNFFQQKPTFIRARQELDTLLKDKAASLNIKITLILLGISWIILLFFWFKLPPQVPLLYSRPWGENQLVNKSLITLLPGLSTFLSLVNLRLASLLFKNEKFLSQVLVWLNLTVAVLAATALVRILIIIT